LAGCLFALDFQFTVLILNLIECADISFIFQDAAFSLFTGNEGGGDGVIVEILPAIFEDEDEGLIPLDGADIVVDACLVFAEEVVSLHDEVAVRALIPHIVAQGNDK
jgi:energy-coupling factor transporter ATP-binding protein EcfA2